MESKEKRYLPFSGRRYQINSVGEVFCFGIKIEPFKNGFDFYVELEWVLGKRKYMVALLVLLAFDKISNLPSHLFDEVEPLYVDNNPGNLKPMNIIYRFLNGPLPVENYPGYYYLPLYSAYAINKKGELVNIQTSKNKRWSLTSTGGLKNQTGGYFYSRVVTDDGFSRVLFRHRAMCMVFLKYGANMLQIPVNHKDGKPGNDEIDNLEWSTYAENNLHAIRTGLRANSCLVVLLKYLITGEVLRFSSIGEASRYLGFTTTKTRHRILNAGDKVFEDRILLKYEDDKPWPQIDLKTVKIYRLGEGGDALARNVFDGRILLFKGTGNGEEHTGVEQATILSHLRQNLQIPIKGWNFKYRDSDSPWPQHTENHLKIYRKYPIYPPSGVLVKDTISGITTFYCSSADAKNAFAFTSAVLRRLVKTKKLFKGKYLFSFFHLRENLGPPVK